MQSLSKYNKGIKYLLCVINIFSKYAWVIPNETWVDQGSEFYNNSLKDFLKINNIEMYLTYNKGKSVVAESFIRTLKNKIFKHMQLLLKIVTLMRYTILLINIIIQFIELLK